MKTKRWFSEQILTELNNQHLNIDNKIDERDVYLRMDATVNELASKNYFENWRLSGYGVDNQFTTTFFVTVIDRAAEALPSYFAFPANYAALPRNGGIVEVWPRKWSKTDQSPVVVMDHQDIRRYNSNPAGNMQGRISGCPLWPNFVFKDCGVGAKYGFDFGITLVIRDSSVIAFDAPYGIPADKENYVIATCVEWYRIKKQVPQDSVRDNKDAA
jgi:hypothetical protein